jgi:transcription elongation factor Elf1
MPTEFDLPCADCGHELEKQVTHTGTTEVTVAACPSCGGHYYPESALEKL